MIFDQLKINDADGTVQDVLALCKLDNVHAFDTKWDDTIVAMKSNPARSSRTICTSGSVTKRIN